MGTGSVQKYRDLVIFGSSEMALLAWYYFTHDTGYRVVAFTVDDSYSESFADRRHEKHGLPLAPFSKIVTEYPPSFYDMHVAVGYKGFQNGKLQTLREAKYHQAKNAGYNLASYVSSKAVTWPDLTVGENCFILELNNIQPTVKIGNNVMLWSGNHIGHETVIEDHVYVASHVCISGYCNIGERTWIGVGSTVRDFCTIGSDCFVTMDASIATKKIENGSVVIGAKSTILPVESPVALKLKTRYFNA
ncbi:MAG: acetyltransferase [Candidatus Omnitrophica bacterium]|nr:acetyltransferase [Candidatus Omnitrophota bacterium]